MSLKEIFNSKIFKAIVGLIISYLILRFGFGNLGNSDLKNYPHDSEVWGSVSDWAMVLVTAVTAYFIWKTLNSQMDVQKVQNEMLKIEIDRRANEIMPVFEFGGIQVHPYYPEKYILYLNKNNAYAYGVELTLEIIHPTIKDIKIKNTFDDNSMLRGSCSFTFENKGLELGEISMFSIDLNFRDVYGNTYDQKIMAGRFPTGFIGSQNSPIKRKTN